MSCFQGRMKEYKNISIDRFDADNLKSTTFFLSHCHEDHTVGLKQPAFYERLKSSVDVFIYCSEVTKILLLADLNYKHLERYIKTFEVGVQHTLKVPDFYSGKCGDITVTLIEAYHCPGSVMFLFEGDEGTVLYTGDFRWENNQAQGELSLKTGESVKEIKSLYIDTTFCSPENFFIPCRQNCVEAVLCMVSEWMSQDKNNVIQIVLRAKYGHEDLLVSVAKKMKCKIHVSKEKCAIYEQISSLRGHFTADPTTTPVHACNFSPQSSVNIVKRGSLRCGYLPPGGSKENIMVIIPSTLFFSERSRLSLADIATKKNGVYRACYSFHSSYGEICDFVSYLKPERVFPNVKPFKDNNMDEVQARLNMFLTRKHKTHAVDSSAAKPLGRLKKRKYSISENNLTDSEGLVFNTPEKKRKRLSSGSLSGENNFIDKMNNDVDRHGQEDYEMEYSQTSSYMESNNSGSELDLELGDLDENKGQAEPVETGQFIQSLSQDAGSGSLQLWLSDDEDPDYDASLESETISSEKLIEHNGTSLITSQNMNHNCEIESKNVSGEPVVEQTESSLISAQNMNHTSKSKSEEPCETSKIPAVEIEKGKVTPEPGGEVVHTMDDFENKGVGKCEPQLSNSMHKSGDAVLISDEHNVGKGDNEDKSSKQEYCSNHCSGDGVKTIDFRSGQNSLDKQEKNEIIMESTSHSMVFRNNPPHTVPKEDTDASKSGRNESLEIDQLHNDVRVYVNSKVTIDASGDLFGSLAEKRSVNVSPSVSEKLADVTETVNTVSSISKLTVDMVESVPDKIEDVVKPLTWETKDTGETSTIQSVDTRKTIIEEPLVTDQSINKKSSNNGKSITEKLVDIEKMVANEKSDTEKPEANEKSVDTKKLVYTEDLITEESVDTEKQVGTEKSMTQKSSDTLKSMDEKLINSKIPIDTENSMTETPVDSGNSMSLISIDTGKAMEEKLVTTGENVEVWESSKSRNEMSVEASVRESMHATSKSSDEPKTELSDDNEKSLEKPAEGSGESLPPQSVNVCRSESAKLVGSDEPEHALLKSSDDLDVCNTADNSQSESGGNDCSDRSKVQEVLEFSHANKKLVSPGHDFTAGNACEIVSNIPQITNTGIECLKTNVSSKVDSISIKERQYNSNSKLISHENTAARDECQKVPSILKITNEDNVVSKSTETQNKDSISIISIDNVDAETTIGASDGLELLCSAAKDFKYSPIIKSAASGHVDKAKYIPVQGTSSEVCIDISDSTDIQSANKNNFSDSKSTDTKLQLNDSATQGNHHEEDMVIDLIEDSEINEVTMESSCEKSNMSDVEIRQMNSQVDSVCKDNLSNSDLKIVSPDCKTACSKESAHNETHPSAKINNQNLESSQSLGLQLSPTTDGSHDSSHNELPNLSENNKICVKGNSDDADSKGISVQNGSSNNKKQEIVNKISIDVAVSPDKPVSVNIDIEKSDKPNSIDKEGQKEKPDKPATVSEKFGAPVENGDGKTKSKRIPIDISENSLDLFDHDDDSTDDEYIDIREQSTPVPSSKKSAKSSTPIKSQEPSLLIDARSKDIISPVDLTGVSPSRTPIDDIDDVILLSSQSEEKLSVGQQRLLEACSRNQEFYSLQQQHGNHISHMTQDFDKQCFPSTSGENSQSILHRQLYAPHHHPGFHNAYSFPSQSYMGYGLDSDATLPPSQHSFLSGTSDVINLDSDSSSDVSEGNDSGSDEDVTIVSQADFLTGIMENAQTGHNKNDQPSSDVSDAEKSSQDIIDLTSDDEQLHGE
ncbi:hypothetical protein ScPMuIL_008945 [Solemya velum]